MKTHNYMKYSYTVCKSQCAFTSHLFNNYKDSKGVKEVVQMLIEVCAKCSV